MTAELGELREALSVGTDRQIADEVGDVLFNVVELVATFEERGVFSLRDVDEGVANKMIRRHPYVFAAAADPGPVEARRLWAEAKQAEVRERDAARLGVSVVAEVAAVPSHELPDAAGVREIVYPVAEALAIGIADDGIEIEEIEGEELCAWSAKPLGALLVRVVPPRGLVFVQAFTSTTQGLRPLRDHLAGRFPSGAVRVSATEVGASSWGG